MKGKHIHLEHKGVVTQLPKLHNSVHEGLGAALGLALGASSLCQHAALLLHVCVEGPLQTRHLTLDDVFNLNILKYISGLFCISPPPPASLLFCIIYIPEIYIWTAFVANLLIIVK